MCFVGRRDHRLGPVEAQTRWSALPAALVDDRDRAYFGVGRQESDQVGYIDESTRAIFGRSYPAEPGVLIEQLAEDETIAAADTLLLTVPNQQGVEYKAHALESIVKFVAPGLGWR